MLTMYLWGVDIKHNLDDKIQITCIFIRFSLSDFDSKLPSFYLKNSTYFPLTEGKYIYSAIHTSSFVFNIHPNSPEYTRNLNLSTAGPIQAIIRAWIPHGTIVLVYTLKHGGLKGSCSSKSSISACILVQKSFIDWNLVVL